MKTKLLSVISLIVLVACAKPSDGSTNQTQGATNTPFTPTEVTLQSRYTSGGDYHTATYSFRYMNQGNVDLTRNNWEILFEARGDFEDYFETDMVVDDTSFIFDLGEISCKQIESSESSERQTRPLVWLGYSNVADQLRKGSDKAFVKLGHCYLAYNNDEDGRVVTLFHVKSYIKHQSVVIDEIEVLNDLRK